MKNYWTCSKFADWLRGIPSLHSGTAEEWAAWEKQAKKNVFRYWLAEEGLDYLQHFIYWPVNRVCDVRRYINNRWITKSHALTSNLKRGVWHDLDDRLLHAAFDELVNFVEIEQAWMQIVCSDEESKKYKAPWYRTILRMGVWRCPEAGIAYLEWASALKHDEEWFDKNDPRYEQPTRQALAAQEILALYFWWNNERPLRPEPMTASGWSDYCEEKRKVNVANGDNSVLAGFLKNEPDDVRRDNILEVYRKIEEEQENEDTAMFVRLIRIRQNLWT